MYKDDLTLRSWYTIKLNQTNPIFLNVNVDAICIKQLLLFCFIFAFGFGFVFVYGSLSNNQKLFN